MTGDYGAGSIIGDYVLDSYIGGGSFGAVWRGHHATEGYTAAVKLLTGTLSASENVAMRADVEVLAAAAASASSHVVKVLGGGTSPVPHIVMEFIDGDSLFDLLNDRGALPIELCVEVGAAICDALRALHLVGVIHRDIKPANVMIDKSGLIKLTDFGIAKIVGYKSLTMTGQTAMTMAYAAPELWDEDGKYGRPSHRSDLYAMGVLLYQCLTGETPFSGNYGALYRAHIERIPDLETLPAGTPPSLRIMIARSLEKRLTDRPQDATECLALLRRATVEIADLQGLPNREPDKFGPWLKDKPHEIVAWAWHCKHERTGEQATVEVHFSDSLEYGSQLSDAVAANPALVFFGAERLIDSNRLLLHPNQEWREAPAGQFQFWVARADLPITQATVIDEPLLRADVRALASLVEAAEASSTRLDLRRDNVTALADGGIYVRRPGLAGDVPASQDNAFNFVRTLPLDAQAAKVVSSATSLAHLRSLVGDEDAAAPEATVRRPADASTVVVASPQAAPPTVIQTSRDAQSVEPRSIPAGATESQKSPPARNRLPLYAGGIAAVAGIAVAFVLFSGGGNGDNSSPEPTIAVGEVATGIAAQATVASTPAVIIPTQPPAPVLPSRAEVMQALENSTQVYITAFRTGDIALLSTVFSGEALAYYQAEMKKMLASSQRQDNAILQTDYLDIQIPSPTRAIVRTRERWSYRLVGQASATQYNYNEYYELDKTPQGWRVSVNTFERIP